jgi:hypothetical protein
MRLRPRRLSTASVPASRNEPLAHAFFRVEDWQIVDSSVNLDLLATHEQVSLSFSYR